MLRFALPMLERIGHLRTATGPGAKMLNFHRGAHETLRKSIRESVRRDLARRIGERGALSLALASDHVAGTFIVLLEWWQTGAPELSAKEVYRHIEELVIPVLGLFDPLGNEP